MLWKGFLLSPFEYLDCFDAFLFSVYQDCLFQSPPKSRQTVKANDSPRKRRRITFADVEGLPLEMIHRLSAADATYTPGKIVPRIEDRLSPTLNRRALPRQESSYTCKFTQPAHSPHFYDKLRCQNVMLETFSTKDRLTQGTVRVTNMAYQKEVVIRWTRNKWYSFREARCSYCQGSGDGTTDRFSFSFSTIDNNSEIEFVVRYKTVGGEFWDNNNGANYTLSVNR